MEELFKDTSQIDEQVLVLISDKLWGFGSLKDIKMYVAPELFVLHIGINMIGNWQAGGWWGIISEQAELVPHIPTALQSFQLTELRKKMEELIATFPEGTHFDSNDERYIDTVNFLQNTRFKVEDEELKAIPMEERKQMVQEVKDHLKQLEQSTALTFGEDSEEQGWHVVHS